MTLTVGYQLAPTKPAFANDDSGFYNGVAFGHEFWADETTPDILGLSNGGDVEATSSVGDDLSTNALYLTFYSSNYNLVTSTFPLAGNEQIIGQPSLTQLANGNVL